MFEEHTEYVSGRKVKGLASVWGFVDRESALTSEDIGPFVARRMPMDFPTTLSIDEDL